MSRFHADRTLPPALPRLPDCTISLPQLEAHLPLWLVRPLQSRSQRAPSDQVWSQTDEQRTTSNESSGRGTQLILVATSPRAAAWPVFNESATCGCADAGCF